MHDFTEAVRIDPNYPGGYTERGQALFKLGETDRAIADYSAAIKRDPNFGPALRGRAMANLYRGATDLALADLSKAIQVAEIDPNRLSSLELFYARRSRATIYGNKMQHDGEIADCTAIIEAYKRDKALNVALVGVYQAEGAANLIADDLPPARQRLYPAVEPGAGARRSHRRRAAERRPRFLRAGRPRPAQRGDRPARPGDRGSSGRAQHPARQRRGADRVAPNLDRGTAAGAAVGTNINVARADVGRSRPNI